MRKQNDVWYEVFIADNKGTRTIEICDTVNEARKIKQILAQNPLYKGKTLYIDKWHDKNNPKPYGVEIS